MCMTALQDQPFSAFPVCCQDYVMQATGRIKEREVDLGADADFSSPWLCKKENLKFLSATCASVPQTCVGSRSRLSPSGLAYFAKLLRISVPAD